MMTSALLALWQKPTNLHCGQNVIHQRVGWVNHGRMQVAGIWSVESEYAWGFRPLLGAALISMEVTGRHTGVE